MRQLVLFLSLSLVGQSAGAEEASTCYGSTSDGRLENGWKLPSSGPNFTSYSTTGEFLGRTYVHSTVHDIVVEAYAALNETKPDTVFVYGETGHRIGGDFAPHKTHQNGLSVDFMVPVLDKDGHSVALPTNPLNKWGYGLEFDAEGRLDDLAIDFEAIAEHIYHLREASLRHRVDIWRVILDPHLQPFLTRSEYWQYLEDDVQFSQRRSWVRHDDHYHVDFEIPCEPD